MKQQLKLLIASLVLAFILCGAVSAADSSSDDSQVEAQLMNVSVPFVENQGQTDSEVSYYAKTFYGTSYVTQDGITHQIMGEDNKTLVVKEQFLDKQGNPITFQAQGENPSATVVSYFTGKDPDNWQTNLPTYNFINLGELYPGITVKLRATGSNIEKLFFVSPGANPDDIQIRILGADGLTIDEEGNLILNSDGFPDVSMSQPKAFQENNNIEAKYQVKDNTYGFTIGNYDQNKPLTIDPTLQYSTYLGGNDYDYGYVAVDGAGNAYITGQTFSTDFPTTIGAYQTNNAGNADAFVTKLNPTGNALVYSTYLGGNDYDYGSGIAVDAAGNAYITGQTTSTNFPTTIGALQPSLAGSSDAFVVKLSSMNYTIIPSAGVGGTISPSTQQTVNHGDDITFIITPNTGYIIVDVTVDGNSLGPVTSYTFTNVQRNHNIAATFNRITYTITPNTGTGGTITPNTPQRVNHGDDITFTITPNTGYIIADVTVDGNSQGPITSYTFTNVQNNHNIAATFNRITYTITPNTGTGGTITPNTPQRVNHGDDITFIITPNTGYIIGDVTVDGNSLGPITSYTFTNVQRNHNIAATFKTLLANVTVSKIGNGPLNVGDTGIFTVVLHNNGPDVAHNVAVTDVNVPDGWSVTLSVGTSWDSNTNTWNVGTLNNGADATLTISGLISTAMAGTTIINTVTESQDEPNQETQTATASITVNPQADLYINSWSSKSNPRVGEIYTITFKLSNRGPDTAGNVVFTLPLPDGVEYVDVNVDQGTASYDPSTRTITWTLGDVVVGDPYAWVLLRSLNVGSFIFRPTLTTDTDDPNIESNIQTVTVNVQAADVSSKTVHVQTVGMQKTGTPIAGIVLAILMVLGGFIGTCKKQ